MRYLVILDAGGVECLSSIGPRRDAGWRRGCPAFVVRTWRFSACPGAESRSPIKSRRGSRRPPRREAEVQVRAGTSRLLGRLAGPRGAGDRHRRHRAPRGHATRQPVITGNPIHIMVEEDDDHTQARAVLTSRDGVSLHGDGNADRKPGDAPIPEIARSSPPREPSMPWRTNSWTPPPMTSRPLAPSLTMRRCSPTLMNGSTAPGQAGDVPLRPAVPCVGINLSCRSALRCQDQGRGPASTNPRRRFMAMAVALWGW